MRVAAERTDALQPLQRGIRLIVQDATRIAREEQPSRLASIKEAMASIAPPVALRGAQRAMREELIAAACGVLVQVTRVRTDAPARRRRAPDAAERERRRLVGTKQFITSTEIVMHLGLSRQALSQAVRTRRIFSVRLRNDDKHYFPAFYADDRFERRAIERVSRALGDLDGWAKWVFFTTPKGSLAKRTPLQAVAAGEVDLAVRTAHGFVEN